MSITRDELYEIILKLDAIDATVAGIRALIATRATLTPPPEPSRFAKSLAQQGWAHGGRVTDNKPYTDATDEELLAMRDNLLREQASAKSWGAAVGVRDEYIKEIERELRCRERVRKYDAAKSEMKFVPADTFFNEAGRTRRATDDLA